MRKSILCKIALIACLLFPAIGVLQGSALYAKIVKGTVKGIDGNLKAGAAKSYKTELSYADPDWSPSYWGGSSFGRTTVTGDGSYSVFATLPGECQGAVVWTVELYNLWKDLVDPTKVKGTINSVETPGKLH